MNDKEDAFLEENEFSREEIEEGIQTMLRTYGAYIPDLVDRNV